VYLDIAWIQEKRSDAADHIRRKLPSMYHQFKELADLDITEQPMEVGPTTHYAMGGVRVDAESQMSTLPGLFAAGEVAAGLHGANRLGGNSLSDLLVFGKRAGDHAAEFAAAQAAPGIDPGQVESARKEALAPFERESGEGPYRIQRDLQRMMQAKVGIVRNEADMKAALEGIAALRERARGVGVSGHREYNPGWHTALDLPNLLVVSEAVARAGLAREESRGAHFREDRPAKEPALDRTRLVIRKGADGMELRRETLPALPPELARIVEENR
jgi:succinate dehydrogenase / fumarate reductase flavoprotein subunit